MIRDWDLWPWLVAAGAPDAMALPVFGMTRNLERFQQSIGAALYPIMRDLARDLSASLREWAG